MADNRPLIVYIPSAEEIRNAAREGEESLRDLLEAAYRG